MTRRHCNDRRMLATLLATAAAVPITIGLAYSAAPVGSRDAAAIERDYGRASGDPYWAHRQEQPVPAPVERAYERTKDWVQSQSEAVAPQQPERYGRGGGYVGLEKFEALDWTMRERTSAVGAGQSSAEGRTGG